MKLLGITIFFMFCLSASTEARPYPNTTTVTPTCMSEGCSGTTLATYPAGRTSEPRYRARRAIQGVRYGANSVVGHPSGCPGRAFCGCGASVRIFGHPVRSLYLAANWLRFPRAHPASGMAAARRGHVFVLEAHVGGDEWMVYDANSGGHATRIHVRSIRGYTIVNPRT